MKLQVFLLFSAVCLSTMFNSALANCTVETHPSNPDVGTYSVSQITPTPLVTAVPLYWGSGCLNEGIYEIRISQTVHLLNHHLRVGFAYPGLDHLMDVTENSGDLMEGKASPGGIIPIYIALTSDMYDVSKAGEFSGSLQVTVYHHDPR